MSTRHSRMGALALAATCAAGVAAAQDMPKVSAETARLCREVAEASPPPTDRPTPAQMVALRGCDAEALYFGIGRPADPQSARLCAFAQRESRQPPADNPDFAGDALLMTIYANGVGAARDLRYATRLACGLDGAVAEQNGRVANLAGKAASGWTGRDFSICDDVTSGAAAGSCAVHAQRVAAVARGARIDRFAAGLTGDAAARFAVLRRAQAAWAQARARHEIDMSGTLRGVSFVEEEDLQDRDFVEMLDRLGTGKPPRLGPAELRAADARLNDIYRRIMAAPPAVVAGWGTVAPDSVRATERVWLAYRDAWGAFAAAAYPALGAAGAQAWVTAKRADMLAALLKS